MDRFLKKIPSSVFLPLLSLIWLLWRFLTLDMVEKGGDAVWKWRVLRCYAETGNWFPAVPDHHLGRWAVLLPQLSFFKLTGSTELWTYYPLPLLYGFLCGWLVYALIQKLSGSRTMGGIGFLVCMIHPLVARESTQFAVMLPCAVWTLGSFIAFLKYRETGKQIFLLLTPFLLFFAWGCKVTAVFWVAVMGFQLLFSGKKKWTDLLMFWGVFLLCLILETLVLNHVYGISCGRLDCLLAVHVPSMQTDAGVPLHVYLFSVLRPLAVRGKYFDFYPRIHVLAGGLVSGFMILRYAGKNSLKRTAVVLLFAGWILFSCAVCSLNPVRYAEPLLGRYYITLVLLALVLILSSGPEWKAFLTVRKWQPKTFWAVLSLLYIIPAVLFMIIEQISHWREGENLFRITEASACIRQAGKENLPVLCRFREGKGDDKYAVMWGSIMLPPDALPEVGKQEYPRIRLDDGNEYLLLSGKLPEQKQKQKILCTDESYSAIRTAALPPSGTLPGTAEAKPPVASHP